MDRDTLLVNRLCQVHNDPHRRTFDGRIYDYMEVGEFVMYRNAKGPYMVIQNFINILTFLLFKYIYAFPV